MIVSSLASATKIFKDELHSDQFTAELRYILTKIFEVNNIDSLYILA